MWSSKGYKVFRVTLIIKENNKDAGAWLVINHRIVKNFRFRWIFWWRHNHFTISNTVLPHEDFGKIHVALCITTTRSVCNRVLSVSCKINTTSKGRAWKKKLNLKKKYQQNRTFSEVICYKRGNCILLILQLLLPFSWSKEWFGQSSCNVWVTC